MPCFHALMKLYDLVPHISMRGNNKFSFAGGFYVQKNEKTYI